MSYLLTPSLQERKSHYRPVAPALPDPPFPMTLAQDEQQIALNAQALKNRLVGRRGGRGATRVDSRSGRGSMPASDTESTNKKTKGNAQRKWGESAPSEIEMASLDFSIDKPDPGTNVMYRMTCKPSGKDDEINGAITHALKNEGAKQASDSLGALSSLFSCLTGSKVLTEQDLKPVLEGIKQHLMKKNVAMEIADKSSCSDTVSATSNAIRTALSSSPMRILMPKTSTDLFSSIRTKPSSPLPSAQQRMPYSITFVGVNGLGKSTPYQKSVSGSSRTACECSLQPVTLSGAMRSTASSTSPHARTCLGMICGGSFLEFRWSITQLVVANNPDKINFVGKAHVGNEAVDQLTKFDRALRDFSSASGSGKRRGIDGMLVTKRDTVGDKVCCLLPTAVASNIGAWVGAALSMTYVTG
ncbi:hypothetical protein EDB19DRAFT_2043655 [Suillus lakei]|nr:hypothetical protein EDB19DRAFT_2043655 [Suillus lakei]